MPAYVALLRGVNVGGRKVPMQDLRALFADLGHTAVRTYIQSGNVVFATKVRSPAAVRSALVAALERDFGFPVAVLLRSAAELTVVLERNPYGAGAYVTFLDEAPDRKLVAALDPRAFAPDEFEIAGREVYVRCPNGYGRTKINNTYFERKLATRATTRNLNTVTILRDWATA